MGTKRRDRTGDEYGSARVIGPDPLNPRLWVIRWGCCGREQSVTIERCTAMHRQIPKRCIRCVRKEDSEDEAYAEARSVRERERRAAAKALDNHPEERRTSEGINVPGWGWAPVLSGPFGRLNATGYEAQNKPPDHAWARDDA